MSFLLRVFGPDCDPRSPLSTSLRPPPLHQGPGCAGSAAPGGPRAILAFPRCRGLGRCGIRRRFGPNEFLVETGESCAAPGLQEPRCPWESGTPGTSPPRAWARGRGPWRERDPGLPQPASAESQRVPREPARAEPGDLQGREPGMRDAHFHASPRQAGRGRRAVGRRGIRPRGYEGEP